MTASTFPRYKGDTEPRFVLDLSKEMVKYFDVTVLAPAAIGAKDEEVLEGVHVIRYHYFPIHRWETLCYPGAIVPRIKEKKSRILLVPFLLLGLWWKMFKIHNSYDIVHAHWIIPQGIIQSFFSVPYIVTGHGGDVNSLNSGIIRKLKIRALKNASHITTVSLSLEKKIKDLASVQNISILPMGCDTTLFGKRWRVEQYFNQKDKKVILFVGRLVEVKGIPYLIKAMENVDAKLIIVGNGPMKKELESMSKPLGEKIVFMGARNHDELRTIYASSDVFVAPSITANDGAKEGFGLVLLEAMASGLPIIGSNSGGIRDIICDGKNGFLVGEKNIKDLSDRINLLISDKKLYEEMSKSALERVKKYDYSYIGEKYHEILEKCLNGER